MRGVVKMLKFWISTNMNVLLVVFLIQPLISDCSPFYKSSPSAMQAAACSKGWAHYHRFCVKRARGNSDMDVALYCDGFGGIGIQGYCITKAENVQLDNLGLSSNVKSDSSFLGTNVLLNSPAAAAVNAVETDNLGNAMRSASGMVDSLISDHEGGNGVCPKAWKHYGGICVYQPLTINEQCNLLNAVPFSGLCLKHANAGAVVSKERRDSKSVSREKRICCCAHIKGIPNGYGCI